MRLLICTQKVAQDDAVLGFMHRWIEVFAQSCESVTVICLEKGMYDLPKNVTVYSLGKEKKQSRLRYVVNFYKLLWKLRGLYTGVFVHMNPEYMVLGGLWWKVARISALMWYNHKMGDWKIRMAALFAKKVLYTSPFAFASRYKKAQHMPAGVDTDQFKPNEQIERKSGSILSLGRIDPVKHIEVIIEALILLSQQGIAFSASLYGSPTVPDSQYVKRIQELAKPLIQSGQLTLYPAVANRETPAIYARHELFVNATPSGSFDKSVLEAMACETLPLSCNRSFKKLLPEELLFKEGDSNDLVRKITALLVTSPHERTQLGKSLRGAVAREQSL